MGFISKVELKRQLQALGVKVEGNYIKKEDIEKIIAEKEWEPDDIATLGQGHQHGYFGHEDRGGLTDWALAEAANALKLSKEDLLLYCDSRNARHEMDSLGNQFQERITAFFIKSLKTNLRELKGEMP